MKKGKQKQSDQKVFPHENYVEEAFNFSEHSDNCGNMIHDRNSERYELKEAYVQVESPYKRTEYGVAVDKIYGTICMLDTEQKTLLDCIHEGTSSLFNLYIKKLRNGEFDEYGKYGSHEDFISETFKAACDMDLGYETMYALRPEIIRASLSKYDEYIDKLNRKTSLGSRTGKTDYLSSLESNIKWVWFPGNEMNYNGNGRITVSELGSINCLENGDTEDFWRVLYACTQIPNSDLYVESVGFYYDDSGHVLFFIQPKSRTINELKSKFIL